LFSQLLTSRSQTKCKSRSPSISRRFLPVSWMESFADSFNVKLLCVYLIYLIYGPIIPQEQRMYCTFVQRKLRSFARGRQWLFSVHCRRRQIYFAAICRYTTAIAWLMNLLMTSRSSGSSKQTPSDLRIIALSSRLTYTKRPPLSNSHEDHCVALLRRAVRAV